MSGTFGDRDTVLDRDDVGEEPGVCVQPNMR